jgi:hypothetical protein
MPADAGLDFAWHVHEAVQSWTASVDAKASIVLAVEVAVAGAAVHLLIGEQGGLGDLRGVHLLLSLLALLLLGVALFCALAVVFPRLARRGPAAKSPDGLIYFGHLRERTPDSISHDLGRLGPAEERRHLAGQLQVTAEIAWRKHSWLQISLLSLVIGSLVLVANLLAYPIASSQNRGQFTPPASSARHELIDGKLSRNITG